VLIRVPPFLERLSGQKAPKSLWEGIKEDLSDIDDDDESAAEDDVGY